VTSDDILEMSPLPSIPGRPIIEGDVVINDLTRQTAIQPYPLIDRLPSFIATIARILGAVVVLFVTLGSGYLAMVVLPASYFRVYRWRIIYQDTLSEYLRSLDLDQKLLGILIRKPWFLDGQLRLNVGLPEHLGRINAVGKQVRGKGIPLPPSPEFEELWQNILSMLVGIVLVLIGLATTAALIVV
jgi:hypothetical protein